RDKIEYRNYLRRAAQLGNSDAQFFYGRYLYENHVFIDGNKKIGKQYLIKSSESNEAAKSIVLVKN
ncbi:31503_t:CDS:1, partial [Racocetra persica]